MTLAQFAIIVYKVGEDGKLRTIKTFRDLTGLKVRESKAIIDNYCYYSYCDDVSQLHIDFERIMIYLHTLPYWKDIKSHIRKTNFDTFTKDNTILI